MELETSGLLFTQNKDGSVRIEVVDYNVSMYGGGDWESWYELDKNNADKLFAELNKTRKGTFKEVLTQEFGETFDIRRFEEFCREHGIEYSHGSWVS